MYILCVCTLCTVCTVCMYVLSTWPLCVHMVCTGVYSDIHTVCVCQFHDIRSLAVDMFVRTVSQGYGQFLENRIHCNTYAGVWVTGESEPTLKDNEICDGQQGTCTSLEMGEVFLKETISMATL